MHLTEQVIKSVAMETIRVSILRRVAASAQNLCDQKE
jgi:hypothetical protein